MNRLGSLLKKAATISSRSIHTQNKYSKTDTIGSRSIHEQNKKSTKKWFKTRNSLTATIRPLGSPRINLGSELDKWVQQGKKVRPTELHCIIRDLRKRRRFSQALQVSEWMANKSDSTFASSERAVQLDLIGRVHGVESAESYFNNLSDEDKNGKTYGALLNCYVKTKQTEKSLSLMQKMKEMGFASSALFYNDLMCLYTNTGEYEKVPGLLNEMKENGVSPDNFSYRICINSYGVTSNISDMEKVLEEMENQPQIKMDWCTYSSVANNYIKAGLTEKAVASLKKLEEKLDDKDGASYNHLISHYASLGDKTAVMRIWQLRKKYINTDYITMLGSLVKLEALEDAEKLFREWEISRKTYDFRVPNVLLIAYSKRGMVEKAEEMLEKLSAIGKITIPNSWGIVSAGYADKNEMKKAAKCMMTAFSVNAGEKGWKPNQKIVSMILSWLGSEGEVGEVEKFVQALKPFTPINEKPFTKNMYHALITANVRAGKDVSGILESMKADNIDETEVMNLGKGDSREIIDEQLLLEN